MGSDLANIVAHLPPVALGQTDWLEPRPRRGGRHHGHTMHDALSAILYSIADDRHSSTGSRPAASYIYKNLQ
jgi:hypothetical protein